MELLSLKPFDQLVRKHKIESCLFYQKDAVVYEYFKNRKTKEKLHKINSVTKSVLSILIGIAIDRGELPSVRVPISEFFPQVNEAQKAITIEHLLTMSPGFDWPEFGAWGGRPFPMINSSNWVSFILGRDMTQPPGQTMGYNSGCSHLLSAILQKATGQTVSQYAKSHLFTPLGITDFLWHVDSKGIAIGGFGLSLRPHDLLKIGRMMLQEGHWSGRQIVSAEWVNASTLPHFHTYPKIGAYGYHWWVLTDEQNQPFETHAYFAMGYGGQYIIVVPQLSWIVIFTSEMYDDTFLPLHMFREYLREQPLS